jgi:hypothetical protein
MKYWLIFFIICFCLLKSHSQTNYILAGDTDTNKVFYYDIVDAYPSYDSYDMNNDGVDDFTFSAGEKHYMNYWFEASGIISLNENLVFVDDQLNPKILNSGDTIGKDSSWSRSNTNFYYHYVADLPEPNSVYSGIWNNVNDKYVGTMVVSGTDSLMGWFLISVSGSFITIKSFAIQKYNQTEDDSIPPVKPPVNGVFVFFDRANNSLLIKVPENSKKEFSAEIYNMQGIKIFQSDLFDSEMKWIAPAALSGIFIVEVFNNEFCITKKKIAFF